MTKKHFITLAERLREAMPVGNHDADFVVWSAACIAVARACRVHNPAFDTERFLQACRGS